MRRWIPQGTFYKLCLIGFVTLAVAACSSGVTSANGDLQGSPTVGDATTAGTEIAGQGTSTTGQQSGTTSSTTSAVTATTAVPTTSSTATGPASGNEEVGYLGCSMSTDAVTGYQQVGGNSLWKAGEGDYSGGSLDLWANRVGANQMWFKFQQKLDANPGTNALWWELCTTEASQGNDFDLGLAVLGEIETRLGAGAIYVSAQPDYNGHVCPTSGANGPQDMQVLAAQLVGTGRVLAGPIQGPLTEAQTRDLCHANESGRLILGNQLIAFFDG